MRCPACHTENPPDSNYCKKCATPLPASPGARPSFATETFQTPVRQLSTGSTFDGRYQVIEELGKGGMGTVYKVDDTEIREKIALKLIKPEVAADPATIERFRNELRLARKIRHKNVCQMYDLNKSPGAYYITMEYVAGEDLKSMIRMQASLSLGTVLSIGKQVCQGLAEAHQLGVVHRDLKPQNIMIDKGGNAKIMDFGIARSLKEKGITGASVMVGTPEYMSPEQAEGKDVDPRSDIYSLGIILYEMTTGRVPFEGETALSIAMKHKGETPKNPRLLNPGIPDDLSGVILKCLEKDRSRRYQSAREVSAELEKIEAGIPTSKRVVPERKPSTSREITVTFRLRKLILPAAIGLVVVAAALFALFRSRGPHYDPKRIIVSVFENQTGDKAHDPVGRIVSDWITQGLSRTGLTEMVTIPPGETAPGTPEEAKRIRALAKETGAGTLVDGSYFLRGQALSFHAQISDMAKDRLIKALDPVDGPAENPMEAAEILRQKIMGALASILDPRIGPIIEVAGQPPTYEAYKEYMAGVDAFFRLDYQQAIDHCSKAIALDPNIRAPLLLAATAYLNRGGFARAEELSQQVAQDRDRLGPLDQLHLDWLLASLRGDPPERLRISRQLAAKGGGIWVYVWGTAALGNNCPTEALKAFSMIDPEGIWLRDWYPYWNYDTRAYHMLGKHKEELKRARQGRRQYPEAIAILYYEARAFSALGKLEKVNRLVDESMNLKPDEYDPGWVMIYSALALRAHGFKKESFQLLDRAMRWLKARPKEETEKSGYRVALGRAYYQAEKWQEARALFEGLVSENPENLNYLALCGMVAARAGDRGEALRISKQLEEAKQPYQFGRLAYNRACIASVLGDKESAIRLLREAVSQGADYWTLYDNMDLEPLKDYGPFKELIKPRG